jgi:predicted transcriptional regulator
MGPEKYTKDEFTKALRQIRNECSISSVSKSTGIPKQTLYDHSKGKYNNKITQMCLDKALTEIEEKALVYVRQGLSLD